MSYCWFSSDNWKSDVYIYDGSEGITCHVSTIYYNGYIPKLPDIKTCKPGEWSKALEKQYRALDKCIKMKHKSDLAGDTFYTKDPQEMIRYLRIIQQEGFHVPSFIFDELESI